MSLPSYFFSVFFLHITQRRNLLLFKPQRTSKLLEPPTQNYPWLLSCVPSDFHEPSRFITQLLSYRLVWNLLSLLINTRWTSLSMHFPFKAPSPPCYASPIEESSVVEPLKAFYSFILQFSFHLSSQPPPPHPSMLPQLICWLIPLWSPEESDQASGWSEQCRFFIKTKLSVFLVEPVGAPLMKVIRRQGGQNNKSFS